MWEILIIAGLIALFFGLIIVSCSKNNDYSLKEKIMEILPDSNCGACGFANCEEYAKALEKDFSLIGKCTVGGKDVADKLSRLLHSKGEKIKKTAIVFCRGGSQKKAEYYGYKSCSAAKILNPFKCKKMCLGYGDCVYACEYGAIKLEEKIKSVNSKKCVACGKCIEACPQGIIGIVRENKACVLCAGKDKKCKTGCIGCGICSKICPENAISIQDSLAVINKDKCSGCGMCVEKCPKKVIRKI
ncbi:MAG: RnfABCDGE type electron transport complex subunit B [Nanoarchaeota archaeon]